MSTTATPTTNALAVSPPLELCNVILRKPTDERNVQAVCRLMANNTLEITGNAEALRTALVSMTALLPKSVPTEGTEPTESKSSL